MKTSEQQFEEWANGQLNVCIPSAWQAWKASREMLCVELPDDLDAHRLSRAVWAAFDRIQHKSGDSGLALLIELEGYGFGVYELEPKE